MRIPHCMVISRVLPQAVAAKDLVSLGVFLGNLGDGQFNLE